MSKQVVKPLAIADAVERKIVSFAETFCDKYAKEAEQYAKENRPWQDRTGQARKLLKGIALDGSEASYDVFHIADGKLQKTGTATIKDSEGQIGFALAHRIDYGKHLEEANDGRYAVLKPTLEHFKAAFLEDARKFFG